MKIEAENMKERVATEDLVRELVRDDARRGDFDWETEQNSAGGWTFSPTALRSLSHNLARDFAFVCVGLCFLHSYVSCNVSAPDLAID